ncbi:MAG: response regulator transcription factor [Gammaproteobacteria bacterium]
MEACEGEDRAVRIRALVASNIRLYREGLSHMLNSAADIEVIGSASSAAETLQQVRDLAPGVVLLDMAMEEAFPVARQIARDSRITKVIALGMPEVETDVLTGAAAGIAGYVTRAGSVSDALEAVRAAARGEVCCSPRIAGFLFRHIAALTSARDSAAPLSGLTTREAQIFRLLRQGFSNKMISRTLGIELPTVKNHVHSILGKLGVHRRAEAVLLFRDERPADPI